ncbi:hypothetical protein AAC387_Pa09g0704 [Persea americana]
MISNYVESEGLSLNVYVGSVLLDIYAKCGNIGKARQVFNEMPEKDVVSWNSMIAGLAVIGFEEEAINLYFQMNESEAKPNDVTFIALLTACIHAGLVELECRFFKSMRRDHNIKPQVEHCACVVDLFCRPGRLDEAFEFICKMEVEPNIIIWGSLLSACIINSNIALAEHAVEKLLLLELENSEVDGMVHKFLVEDTSHPRLGEIYNVVDGLGLQLKLPCCSAYSVLELSS